MKKVAVFVEGQAELIFVRNILYHLIDPSKFSFKCFRLYADSEQEVPYTYPNPNAEFYFQIINVGNDEGVLNAIKDRERLLCSKGFSKVIGLRDMYSKSYRNISNGVIDSVLNQKFVESANKVISEMSNSGKIIFHFSIMELESWWLSMYNLFAKINEILTVNYISENLGINLSQLDPQTEFFHPTAVLDRVFSLVGSSYKKSFSEIESITSNIDYSDIKNATENDRCMAFKAFCDDLIFE